MDYDRDSPSADLDAAWEQTGPFEPPSGGPEIRRVPLEVPVGGQYDLFHEDFKARHVPPAHTFVPTGDPDDPYPPEPPMELTHLAEGADREGRHVMLARYIDPDGYGDAAIQAYPQDSGAEGIHSESKAAGIDLPAYRAGPEGTEIGMIAGSRRARGLAPLMYHFGWTTGDRPLHSPDRTDEGLAFSRKVGGPDVRGYDQSDAVRTPRHYGTGSASDPAVQEALRLSQEDESGRPYAGEVEV